MNKSHRKALYQSFKEKRWGVYGKLNDDLDKEFRSIVGCFSPLTLTSKLSNTNKDKLVKASPTHLPVIVGEYTVLDGQGNKPSV